MSEPCITHSIFAADVSSSHSEDAALAANNEVPRKYEGFANKALYYSFNTAKVGAALGIFCAVLTISERIARWLYRNVRGSIDYWRNEIKDLKTGGIDRDQLAFDKDGFANEGWQSPIIEERSQLD